MELIHETDVTREKGTIIEIHGNTATVRIDKASSCAHCKANCMEQSGSMIAEAANPAGAQEGDTVLLTLNSRAALTASLITFGIPLLALLLGVVLGNFMANEISFQGNPQLLSIGAGAILFILSFIPLRIYDRRIKESGECSVTVIEVLDEPR